MRRWLKYIIFFAISIIFLDASAEVNYVKGHSEIQKRLPSYTTEDIDGLVFRRQGKSSESFMDALGLHQVFEKERAYTLTKEGLISTDDLSGAKKIPQDFLKKIVKPQSVLVKAKWIKSENVEQKTGEQISNILGGNGLFVIQTDSQKIVLPIEAATSEKLAYYGAVAIPLGEKVIFPPEDTGYPIWAMSLGKDYTKDYIMTEKGGGWYVEWHTDRPHFHMPISKDAGGFYVLGKAVDDSTYEFTAFKIPFGTAVFTNRGAIHCDAGLTGDRWVVGYTTSKNFSTVLLRNKKDELVDIVTE